MQLIELWCSVAHGQYHRQLGHGAYVCDLCYEALKLRREKAGTCYACGLPPMEHRQAATTAQGGSDEA